MDHMTATSTPSENLTESETVPEIRSSIYGSNGAAGPVCHVLVRRILRKHGYPPDKQERATQTVLEQAELLSEEWVG